MTEIKGYRVLDAQEISDVNTVKELGLDCDILLTFLGANDKYDKRWLAIAKTHLQEGLMAATRAITRPTGF